MVAFDFSIQSLSACTPLAEQSDAEPVVRPIAEQLSWYLSGTATFQTSSEEWTEQAVVIEYRDQGEWYFTPPQSAMQDKWEKVHYTEADFARDRRDEIDIPNPPSSPIEITDVHAHMNRRFPSLRSVGFILRNKMSKKVVALSVKIANETEEGRSRYVGAIPDQPERTSQSGTRCPGFASLRRFLRRGLEKRDHHYERLLC